jgi:hypothetical protein
VDTLPSLYLPRQAYLGAWVQHESTGFHKRFQTNNLALTLSHSGPGGRRFKSSLPDHFLSRTCGKSIWVQLQAKGRLLADVQVRVVGEAGKRHFVVARYVEAKLAQAEIRAGLRPAIQDSPTVTVFDLVDELRRANAD